MVQTHFCRTAETALYEEIERNRLHLRQAELASITRRNLTACMRQIGCSEIQAAERVDALLKRDYRFSVGGVL